MATGSFKGNFAKLDKWTKQIAQAGNPHTMHVLNERLARVSMGLIEWGFRNEREPSGKRWKRRSKKQFKRGKSTAFERLARADAGGKQSRPNHPILQDTEKLKKGWRISLVTRQGFELRNYNRLALIHQNGIKGGKIIRPKKAKALAFASGNRIAVFKKVKQGAIPARPMVPRASARLPRRWSAAFEKSASRLLLKVLRGKGAINSATGKGY